MKRKLRWPFKTSEVKSLMSDIERHKTTLGLALEADGVAGLLQVLSGQKDLSTSIEDIKTELRLKREIDVRVMLNEERYNILETFGRIDPGRSHDMSRKLRHPGTGMWLIEHPTFKDWLRSTNGCLWLYGIPGAGKTVLASLAIDEVLQTCTPNHAVAYFYCDYKDQATQEPHGIMGCLAQQIAKQDEQSFEKLRRFYKIHGQGRKDPVPYDPTLLRNLVRDLMSNYENTTIIIDALDECTGHVSDVVALLTSLNDKTDDVNVNLLLLSRDEVEIRDIIDTNPQISIAAENSDLRLYVGAEIEERIGKKKLNIKSPSLKEHIVERLIGGADGMFRWVTCQMDYLCELPNDAARRKALNNLPRGLTPSYERILRKINGCDAEVQKLVRRTFHWLFCSSERLKTRALCQAVAIEPGDLCIDDEAVPDESDILRHCGSLIRKSADGEELEFAHFTVKEFLSQLNSDKSNEFAAYVIDADFIRTELAKVCLTYITMQDFGHDEEMSEEAYSIEIGERPFRAYATCEWPHLVCDWHDAELFNLLKKLFHPSKSGAFISWARWLFKSYFRELNLVDGQFEGNVTPLHYAAMLCIPEICEWLIDYGCDINRWSCLGTPLQCAILTFEGCAHILNRMFDFKFIPWNTFDNGRQLETVDLLLAAGSRPNEFNKIEDVFTSSLSLALQLPKPLELTLRLLMKGSSFNEQNLEDIGRLCDDENKLQKTKECLLLLAQRLCKDVTKDVTQEIILNQALMRLAGGKTKIRETPPLKKLSAKDLTNINKAALEKSMRTAAEFGRLESMIQLLDQYDIFVDAACQSTGRTALHLAAANDHLDSMKTLIDRGADIATTDFKGRMALHHGIKKSSYACIRFLLEQDINVNIPDNDGMTVWHMTVSNYDVEALKLLIEHHNYKTFPAQKDMTINEPQSPLSFAARWASVDFLSLLMSCGCSIHEIDAKGLTPLHHALEVCSMENIQFLIKHGADLSLVTLDGSNALHLVMDSNYPRRHKAGSNRYHEPMERYAMERYETAKFLIGKGLNPFQARLDGSTPIDILIERGSDWGDAESFNKILQMFVQWRNPDQSVQLDLSQTLLRLCQLNQISEPLWLSNILETLLQDGADLIKEIESGKTAFRVLLYSWLRQFSILDEKDINWLRVAPHKATTVIHTALNHVSLETFSGSDYDLPSLLSSALSLGDEILARKLLEFCPDVDRVPTFGRQQLSVMEAACRWSCSDELFKAVLDRSKASSDQLLAMKLFAQVIKKRLVDLADMLLDAGVSPNSCSIRGETPLMLACGEGYVEMVEWLIKHGGDAKPTDQDGWNASHHACKSGHWEIIRVLQKTDIDWHARVHAKFDEYDCDGVTLIHIAAFYARSNLMKYLVDEGIAQDLNCTTSLEQSPLFLATWVGDFETVAFLLSKNVMINIMSLGMSPLHMCSHNGNRELYSLLRSQDYDPRTPNKQGLDCEMLAWKHGHKELAEEISRDKLKMQNRASVSPVSPRKQALQALKLGIELDDLDICKNSITEGASLESHLPGSNGHTPLSYCVEMIRPEIAEFLVLKGVSHVTISQEYTLFHFAARGGDWRLLKVLLEKHPLELLQNVGPLHPIHVAILASAPECVKLMLNHPYQDHAPGLTSAIDLHKPAPYAGNLPTSNVLTPRVEHPISFLINVSIKESASRSFDPAWSRFFPDTYVLDDIVSCTPLHLAALVGDCDSAKILLASGSRVNAVTCLYQTALHIAAREGDCAITELLLDSGANIFARDMRLETPPMKAAARGRLSVLQTLLRKGVDPKARNFRQETILHLAAQSGSTESLAYILNTKQKFDVETECEQGISVLAWAFGCCGSALSFLLNLAPSAHTYFSNRNNILASAITNPKMTVQHVKMLLKRVPPELLTLVLDKQGIDDGTPLYAASVTTCEHKISGFINLLLDAGASIEKDGGPYGTPLMAACTMGRLLAVKILISRGAQTTFVRGGQTMNVLDAARNFPDIIRWLLVGRFAEGRRCLRLDSDIR